MVWTHQTNMVLEADPGRYYAVYEAIGPALSISRARRAVMERGLELIFFASRAMRKRYPNGYANAPVALQNNICSLCRRRYSSLHTRG